MIHEALQYDAARTTWAIAHGALDKMLAGNPDTMIARRKLPRVAGRVAVLPVHGMISQRASIWQDLFGGTATEGLASAYSRAVNDDRISAIVLDVDSPGGTVAGVQEVADIISQGSQIKETAAIANSEAASAAYWIASQVGPGQKRFAAAPNADIGSIGVYRMHEDVSQAVAAEGVQVTFLAVPEYKVEANPYEPLSAEAINHHMDQVNATYENFVSAVSRGRGVTAGVVKDQFGKGRTFDSERAVQLGLIDRVATMSDLFRELGASGGGGNELSAADTQDVTDTLCHAFECGTAEQMRDWQRERRERVLRLARAY